MPLIEDAGNRKLLVGWLEDDPDYDVVRYTEDIAATAFDICIIDTAAFERHLSALRAKKAEVSPVLLPYLLLVPESGTEIIESDDGELADNFITETIDELVSLPIKQAELNWRLKALLRLRNQSLALRANQRELERQIDLFEKAQDIADVGAWEYDIETDSTWFTDETHRIYGVPTDETPSVSEGLEFYHPDDRPIIREAFERAVAGEESYDLELRLVDDDGAERWVRTRGEPQFRNGNPSLVRGTIQDITQRKEREETVRLQKQTVDEAPVGITISDAEQADNPLIYVNDAFVEITGYEREEALGRNCRFLQGENTDPEHVAMVRRGIDNEEIVSGEIRNYRKDGTMFWNYLQIAPVYEDGEVVNYIGFQEDITSRKEREEQFAVLDRVLRHNIRNDMNVIRGRAEMLMEGVSGELANSAETILHVSNDLLDLAEKERQITALLREPTEIVTIPLADALERSAATVREAHPSTKLSVSCPGDLTVEASVKIEQAFTELMTNATIHNFGSAPEVLVSVRTDGETVQIDFADDGPRIPALERDLVGSETDQTPLKHKRGLGLWLVRLLTARSGGTLSISKRSPSGNVVTIELQH
jgi:PAS domain S-box-containing protein